MKKINEIIEKFNEECIKLGYDGGFESDSKSLKSLRKDFEEELEVLKESGFENDIIELVEKYLEELK